MVDILKTVKDKETADCFGDTFHLSPSMRAKLLESSKPIAAQAVFIRF